MGYGLAGAGLLGWLVLAVFQHGERRIQAWLSPFHDPTGDSWQVLQGLSGMYSGGLWGEGFGAGNPEYTPIAESDFIYAVIGEELGFVGGALVMAFFLLIFLRGLQIAYRARSSFGLLLAGGFEGMDDSIRTMNDAEAYLRLPVLSTVPRLQSSQVKRRPLVMNDDARFSGAEAFRALRTSLFLHDPDGRNRSFLFTSTMPGEGKTFCALNFAASLAQQGFRTLLVDADLRRPMLEKMILGGKKGVPGVINHLKGEAITIQQTMIENLFLMPAGTIHSNPAELLARNGLRDLLEESLREFDRVVLDSAPIFGVSDTLRLVRDVQVVCLVVRARRTPRKQVRRCLQMLQRASAPLAGIVLNGVPTSRRVAYDSPYHDYGYYGGPPAKPEKKAAAPAVPTGVMNFAPPAPPPNRRAARG
jgi:capsular exopolysaccharide synthesis family protein